MENIDNSLNSLIKQIDVIDGNNGKMSFSSHLSHGLSHGLSNTSFYIKIIRQYVFYWSLFLFLFIILLIIKPSSVYKTDKYTNKVSFSWSYYFMTLFSMYFIIISII